MVGRGRLNIKEEVKGKHMTRGDKIKKEAQNPKEESKYEKNGVGRRRMERQAQTLNTDVLRRAENAVEVSLKSQRLRA